MWPTPELAKQLQTTVAGRHPNKRAADRLPDSNTTAKTKQASVWSASHCTHTKACNIRESSVTTTLLFSACRVQSAGIKFKLPPLRAERGLSGLAWQALYLKPVSWYSSLSDKGLRQTHKDHWTPVLPQVRTMREDNPASSHGRSDSLAAGPVLPDASLWVAHVWIPRRHVNVVRPCDEAKRRSTNPITGVLGLRFLTRAPSLQLEGASPSTGLVTQSTQPEINLNTAFRMAHLARQARLSPRARFEKRRKEVRTARRVRFETDPIEPGHVTVESPI